MYPCSCGPRLLPNSSSLATLAADQVDDDERAVADGVEVTEDASCGNPSRGDLLACAADASKTDNGDDGSQSYAFDGSESNVEAAAHLEGGAASGRAAPSTGDVVYLDEVHVPCARCEKHIRTHLTFYTEFSSEWEC